MLCLLLALALAAGPCGCPVSTGAGEAPEPLALIPDTDGSTGLVACGYLDHREADDVIATEFDIFACGSNAPVLTFSADQTARIHGAGNSLVVAEVESWPFGPDWSWVWVPVWSFKVTANSNQPVVSKSLVLKPPALSDAQITEALRPLETPDAIPIDHYSDVIGRLLAAALAGNNQARQALEALPQLLPLDGHNGETYVHALQTYRAACCPSAQPAVAADAAPLSLATPLN